MTPSKPSINISSHPSEKPLDWDTSNPKTSKSLSEMLNALPPSIDFFDEEKAVKKKETKVYKPIGRLDYNPGVAEIPAIQDDEANRLLSILKDYAFQDRFKMKGTLTHTIIDSLNLDYSIAAEFLKFDEDI